MDDLDLRPRSRPTDVTIADDALLTINAACKTALLTGTHTRSVFSRKNVRAQERSFTPPLLQCRSDNADLPERNGETAMLFGFDSSVPFVSVNAFLPLPLRE